MIPTLGSRVLIDPETRLTILRDADEQRVDQIVRPIDMRDANGAHWFGPRAIYPYVRAIVTGYYLAHNSGRESLFYDDPQAILGITYVSPAGYLIVAPLEAIVQDLGDQPFPPNSGPPCTDEDDIVWAFDGWEKWV